MDAARAEARLSAKECDCVGNVRSCRFAVAVASFARSFDELRCYDRQLMRRHLVQRRFG
jgi:hypothetical protein